MSNENQVINARKVRVVVTLDVAENVSDQQAVDAVSEQLEDFGYGEFWDGETDTPTITVELTSIQG